jgi:hypothetical protein
VDTSPIKIIESQDFYDLLSEYTLLRNGGQTDLICTTNEYFSFFWPGVSSPGISMWKFNDLSAINQPTFLNSQCQIFLSGPTRYRYGLIRSSSLGNKVLTAWTDGREDGTRIYGNFFDVDEYVTEIEEENQIMMPEDFSISQNYPNPFNPITRIDFQLPEPSHVVAKVYDIFGREVRTLVEKQYEAGPYYLTWDARDNYGDFVSSGIYIYEINAGKFSQAKKMTLIK